MSSVQRRLLASLLSLVLMALCMTYAHACTCMLDPDPPCRAAGHADAIFEAEVLRRESVELDSDLPLSRRFTMKVKRTFKGSIGQAVFVYTGVGDSDCGYRFKVGSRYLVYAYENDGRLTAGICTRTRKIENAESDLAYFNQLPTMPSGGSIFGSAVRKAWRNEEWATEPFPGIKIEIDGPEKKTILTNPQGSFSVSGLAPGDYRVTALIPEKFKLSPSSRVELYPYPSYEEKIPDKGCLETYFVLEPNT